jgi:hypothetical protein
MKYLRKFESVDSKKKFEQSDLEEISDDLVDSSDSLAKFWTILNDCLKRLRNGDFEFKSTSSTESSLSILLSFN